MAADDQFCIAEALSPVSKLTSLEDYLREMNREKDPIQVRILRIPEDRVTMQEREAVNSVVMDCYLNIPYPKRKMWRLAVFRFVNSLPWEIEGVWCTKLSWEPWESIVPGILDRPPDGAKKKNPTPRTFENRLIAGVLVDVTSTIIMGGPGLYRFHTSAMMPGDIVCVRAYATFSKAIRKVLGSYTNHNGILVNTALEPTPTMGTPAWVY